MSCHVMALTSLLPATLRWHSFAPTCKAGDPFCHHHPPCDVLFQLTYFWALTMGQ